MSRAHPFRARQSALARRRGAIADRTAGTEHRYPSWVEGSWRFLHPYRISVRDIDAESSFSSIILAYTRNYRVACTEARTAGIAALARRRTRTLVPSGDVPTRFAYRRSAATWRLAASS